MNSQGLYLPARNTEILKLLGAFAQDSVYELDIFRGLVINDWDCRC